MAEPQSPESLDNAEAQQTGTKLKSPADKFRSLAGRLLGVSHDELKEAEERHAQDRGKIGPTRET